MSETAVVQSLPRASSVEQGSPCPITRLHCYLELTTRHPTEPMDLLPGVAHKTLHAECTTAGFRLSSTDLRNIVQTGQNIWRIFVINTSTEKVNSSMCISCAPITQPYFAAKKLQFTSYHPKSISTHILF